MQEETEVLGENLCGQVWIENQIHIRLWPDWESNPGRIGERHGNIRLRQHFVLIIKKELAYPWMVACINAIKFTCRSR